MQDLAAIVAETGETPFVFGQSSGAALSLEAAASGVPVRGLVVNEPPYVPGPATTAETASELAALADDGRRDEAVERFMQGSGIPEAMIEQTKASPAWPALLALAHTLAYDVRLLNEGVVPAQRLHAIACPVLGTTGSLSAALGRRLGPRRRRGGPRRGVAGARGPVTQRRARGAGLRTSRALPLTG